MFTDGQYRYSREILAYVHQKHVQGCSQNDCHTEKNRNHAGKNKHACDPRVKLENIRMTKALQEK